VATTGTDRNGTGHFLSPLTTAVASEGDRLRGWEGHRFGVTSTGEVWVEGEVLGDEPAPLWQILEAHAQAWRAIEGTRKRLPAHRLKVCGSCGSPVLTLPATTRCKQCRSKRKLIEVRMIWVKDWDP
jgi:hypothetical protein